MRRPRSSYVACAFCCTRRVGRRRVASTATRPPGSPAARASGPVAGRVRCNRILHRNVSGLCTMNKSIAFLYGLYYYFSTVCDQGPAFSSTIYHFHLSSIWYTFYWTVYNWSLLVSSCFFHFILFVYNYKYNVNENSKFLFSMHHYHYNCRF